MNELNRIGTQKAFYSRLSKGAQVAKGVMEAAESILEGKTAKPSGIILNGAKVEGKYLMERIERELAAIQKSKEQIKKRKEVLQRELDKIRELTIPRVQDVIETLKIHAPHQVEETIKEVGRQVGEDLSTFIKT